MSELPPGLKKRWEEFGELSRKCWLKAKELKVYPQDQFPVFWECMKEGDPVVSQAEIKECASIGHTLAPHPICVIAQTVRGISPDKAVENCIAEGRIHGISLLACRAAKAGELT
jgi:hypothetical protein